MTQNTADPRLAKLCDEAEIRNIIAKLAHLADFAPTLDEYLQLFAEDAEWASADITSSGAPKSTAQSWRGRAAIAGDRMRLRAEGFQGPGSNRFHVNTTLAVSVGDDGTAHARSYWLFVDGAGEPQLRRIGYYDDLFVRTADGWKLARRLATPNN